MPKNQNDTDYSRVKGWYLDGKAKHLRQTLLFSSISTPLINALFTSTKNISGKVRIKQPIEKGKIKSTLFYNYRRVNTGSCDMSTTLPKNSLHPTNNLKNHPIHPFQNENPSHTLKNASNHPLYPKLLRLRSS